MARKLGQHGLGYIKRAYREHLIRLSLSEHTWLSFSPMSEAAAMIKLQQPWTKLCFIQYNVNGTDDVIKFRKWERCSSDNRFITMERPGFTEKLKNMLPAITAEYFIGTRITRHVINDGQKNDSNRDMAR